MAFLQDLFLFFERITTNQAISPYSRAIPFFYLLNAGLDDNRMEVCCVSIRHNIKKGVVTYNLGERDLVWQKRTA